MLNDHLCLCLSIRGFCTKGSGWMYVREFAPFIKSFEREANSR